MSEGKTLVLLCGVSGKFAFPIGYKESIGMDFVFGLAKDSHGNRDIVVFVDRLRKMAHLAAIPVRSMAKLKHSCLPIECLISMACLTIGSDLVPHFNNNFLKTIFQGLTTFFSCSKRIIHRSVVKTNALIATQHLDYYALVLELYALCC